ncbi:MAG: hypothetical protein MUF52_04335 [Syntrophobacteraceae bacterium]|nr:hypothetical protein [Syntrophobacteraceae bacterium]
MIGAVSSQGAFTQAPPRMGDGAPVPGAAQAGAGGSRELLEQVSEIIQSQGETAEVMLQAQVSLFKTALDMRQSSASSLLQMLRGLQALQAPTTEPHVPPGSIIARTA